MWRLVPNRKMRPRMLPVSIKLRHRQCIPPLHIPHPALLPPLRHRFTPPQPRFVPPLQVALPLRQSLSRLPLLRKQKPQLRHFRKYSSTTPLSTPKRHRRKTFNCSISTQSLPLLPDRHPWKRKVFSQGILCQLKIRISNRIYNILLPIGLLVYCSFWWHSSVGFSIAIGFVLPMYCRHRSVCGV